MTPFASRLAVIAACGLALLAAPLFGGLAQAFTFENQGGVANDDGSRSAIADPDARVSRFGSGFGSGNGQSTFKQGNTTFQFGAQPSFDQRYDSNRLFDPGSRLNDER
jgi:hypothetical protein